MRSSNLFECRRVLIQIQLQLVLRSNDSLFRIGLGWLHAVWWLDLWYLVSLTNTRCSWLIWIKWFLFSPRCELVVVPGRSGLQINQIFNIDIDITPIRKPILILILLKQYIAKSIYCSAIYC